MERKSYRAISLLPLVSKIVKKTSSRPNTQKFEVRFKIKISVLKISNASLKLLHCSCIPTSFCLCNATM